MKGRCWCGHPHALHTHYREGSDCGSCGPGACPSYAPRSAPMPPSHALAAAYSDAWTYRNLAALAPFAQSRPPAVPVPHQRRPRGSIAGQYAKHLKTTGRPR